MEEEMITGTLFLSKKVKVVIESDGPELSRAIEELITKHTGYKATIGISGSEFASGDVSVNLFDIGNMAGYKVDAMAYAIKSLISVFFLKRHLIVSPFKIPVTSHVAVAN